MNDAAAIDGTFSDYRLVKSRGILQLIVEIPVERQAAAFEALGYPVPGADIHVALARLVQPASAPAAPSRSDQGKERYAAMSLAEQAKTRASLLPRDEQFRAWVAHEEWPIVGEIASEEEAVEFIRETCCNGGSRKLIADDPECYDKFLALETEYLVAVGRMAEPR